MYRSFRYSVEPLPVLKSFDKGNVNYVLNGVKFRRYITVSEGFAASLMLRYVCKLQLEAANPSIVHHNSLPTYNKILTEK